VKKHQDARRIATGNHRILSRDAVHIDGSEFDVVCYRPNSANLVEPFSPFRPTNRPWLRAQ
jgi:hypothetical protein